MCVLTIRSAARCPPSFASQPPQPPPTPPLCPITPPDFPRKPFFFEQGALARVGAGRGAGGEDLFVLPPGGCDLCGKYRHDPNALGQPVLPLCVLCGRGYALMVAFVFCRSFAFVFVLVFRLTGGVLNPFSYSSAPYTETKYESIFKRFVLTTGVHAALLLYTWYRRIKGLKRLINPPVKLHPTLFWTN